MTACVAYGCTNRPQRDRKRGITFHKFPKEDEMRQKWVNAIRRESFTPSKWSNLCSIHFREEDVDRTSLSCVRLREGAVPCLFKSFPPHLKHPEKKPRNPPAERQLISEPKENPPEQLPGIIEAPCSSTDSPEKIALKCILKANEYYNETEAAKYTSNSRIIEIQQRLSERAIELLALPEDEPCFILDIGCGSGLSGEVLTEYDHTWVGIDISSHMLDVAREREVEGDLILGDMGNGLPFRPGTFDGVISISALQWLCNADKKFHSPAKRMLAFFRTMYAVMSRGSRAIFQLYPENSAQLELLTQQAMKSGFTGGLVVDFPNSSKAKKIFLCLFCGGSQTLPTGLGTEEANPNVARMSASRERSRKPLKTSRNWIVEKKERWRRQGREVREDTKYTGRKRKGHHF